MMKADPMDLSQLTDNELHELRSATLGEQERRAHLAAIPPQVANLTAQYVAAGGNQSDLLPVVESV